MARMNSYGRIRVAADGAVSAENVNTTTGLFPLDGIVFDV